MKIFKYKKKAKNKKRINRKLPLWILVSVFVAIQILFTIETATSGGGLNALENIEEREYKKNQSLKEVLVSSMSLSDMEKKAEELEFIKPQTTIYLGGEEFVARVP